MPIYEYQCGACGHQLEALQKFSEAPLTECPKCHQMALNKLISAAGFQLKGSGWYATDYKAKPSTTKTEDGAGTSTKTTETKTTETKTTEAKKEE